MKRIDLNTDLGEGGADDTALLELVDSANIACGGHAGSEEIMRRTIGLAIAAGVAAGAHPGYEDRENFGRREMELPPDSVTDLVARQVEIFAAATGGTVHHVKPHGALYNQANRDASLALAVVRGIQKISPGAMLYALPASALAAAGLAAGMTVRTEGFADRRYQADGSLVPRGDPAAVISDVAEAVAQALKLARSGCIDTLCVHGDGPRALAILRALRAAFPAE
jgi:UPF0271 protein